MNKIEQKMELKGIAFLWAKFASKSPKQAALIINVLTLFATLATGYTVVYHTFGLDSLKTPVFASIDHACIVILASGYMSAIGIKANTTTDPTLLAQETIDNINAITNEVKSFSSN